MNFPVNPNIKDVLFPPIVEIKRLVQGDRTASGLPYLDLCQAVPDYAPHPDMLSYLQGRIPEAATALYTSDEGLDEVRGAVCRRYQRLYGASFPIDNVCLTVGASQAFWLAMTTLCQAGDEVIVQVPGYFDYDMALRMMGVSCVYAPFNEAEKGVPDLEAIARLITPKTRALLLVSPSNPTGTVIPGEVIGMLYELAEACKIALVLDETYADFIAGGARPHRLFEKKDWGRHLVHIMSFGKSYAMTGYRAGALIASEDFLAQALKAHDTMAICQTTSTQIALGYALDHLDHWVAENRTEMERRHDRFRAEFEAAEIPFDLVTSGAFFGWVKHPYPDRTASQLVRSLVRESGLILLPGEIFGPGMSRYLRVAFGNITEEVIPEAVGRFARFAP